MQQLNVSHLQAKSYTLNKTGLNQYENTGGYQFSYDDEHFSPKDIRMLNEWGVNGYLVTPSDKRLKYDYDPESKSGTIGLLDCGQCKEDDGDSEKDS